MPASRPQRKRSSWELLGNAARSIEKPSPAHVLEPVAMMAAEQSGE
jgi:hypothetical protein